MTVKELIELLVQYPQQARVVVAGYEGGYNDILKLNPIPLQLNAHAEWWYGQHERSEEGAGEQAVFLEGKNEVATD
ncbi:MAG: hypothetical protein IPM82_28420 [Saprospiraceae bacterium]|nr:hypothetical protein [Saprospiraceae bacterium]